MGFVKIALFLVLIAYGGESKRAFPGGTSKPKIWLNNYMAQDEFELSSSVQFQNAEVYENMFLSKNGSEYVISSEVRQAEFVCEASYPITWKAENPVHLSGASIRQILVGTERVSNFSENLSQPKTIKYQAYLQTNSISHAVGANFICQKISSPSVQSSIYIYTEGKSQIRFLKEVIPVNVTASSSKVVLPCLPALPSISISLFKRKVHQSLLPNSNKNSSASEVEVWEPIYLSPSVTFNPRVGFTLDKNTPLDIYGRFKCVVDGEEDSMYTFVEVQEGGEPNYDFTPNKHITDKRAKLYINSDIIRCCTSDKDSPAVGDSYNCGSEAECELLKPVFMHDVSTGLRTQRSKAFDLSALDHTRVPNCYRTTMNNIHTREHLSMLVLCSGKGIDVVAHFVTGYGRHLFRGFQIFDLQSKMTVENKIYFEVQSPLLARDILINQRYSSFGYGGLSLYRRNRRYRGRPSYMPVFDGYTFEGQALQVTCMTHPYFHSKGGWLQLNWKNGSRTVFAQSQKGLLLSFYDRHNDMYVEYLDPPKTSARLTSVAKYLVDRVSATVSQVSLDMTSFDCFAPIWNSDKWEMNTYKLNVQPSVLPELEGLYSEDIHLKLNQTGVTLSCTVKRTNETTQAPPLITWEKDGKALKVGNELGIARYVYTRNVTSSTLSLNYVTHITQGEYHCVAKNVKGEVRKVWKIFVADETGNGGGTMLVISFVCVGLLGLLVGFLVWRHWHLRKNIIGLLSR